MATTMANPTLSGDEQVWRWEVVSQQSREGLESNKIGQATWQEAGVYAHYFFSFFLHLKKNVYF